MFFGSGVMGPLRFSKFPLSDHGVHAKIVQTPPQIYTFLQNNFDMNQKQRFATKFCGKNLRSFESQFLRAIFLGNSLIVQSLSTPK